MRFVAIKCEACSSVLVVHRTRDFLVRQRTQTGNAVRAPHRRCAKPVNFPCGMQVRLDQSLPCWSNRSSMAPAGRICCLRVVGFT